ncbi:MAG: cytochrome c [Gammaproteobacteria bacterium]
MLRRIFVIAAALVVAGLISTVQAAGDIALGKTKAAQCAGCHGADGRGNEPNPSLAGKDLQYLAKQMHDYKSGARQHAMMGMLMKPLGDQDIADLAAYYASLKTK